MLQQLAAACSSLAVSNSLSNVFFFPAAITVHLSEMEGSPSVSIVRGT
jgi:hypothetical protein